MSIRHVVDAREHLASIAQRYGVPDTRALWDEAENAPLREQRESPFVLARGDVVMVPTRPAEPFGCSTGTRHRFVARRETLELHLCLRDATGAPVRDAAWRLEVGGTTHEGTTDGDGLLSCVIPRDASSGRLTLGEQAHELEIGALDPVDVPSGWRARLRQLGYDPGEGDERDPQARLAIEEFQHEHGIRVTGAMDDATRAQLRDAHGL